MARATRGQRLLLYGLFVTAILIFTLGIVVVWAFSYGPLS